MSRLTLLLVVASVAGINAQSTQGRAALASPAFDVASIKPIGPPGGVGQVFGSVGFPPGGQFVARNVPLTAVLRAAYPDFAAPGRIADGPHWIRTQLFEITANASGDPSPKVAIEMLKHLLADRFALKVRTEQREIDVYALVVARPDGRLGPGLQRAAVACEARDANAPSSASPSLPANRAPRLEPRGCNWISMAMNGVVRFAGRGQPLSGMIPHLQINVDRAVIDRTGLNGRFDVELEHAIGAAPSTSADHADAPAPILTAIREQLGLKLESGREQLEVLVIDHVDMPTSN